MTPCPAETRTRVMLALGAAFLFGLSAPAAKTLVAVTDPWLLAGLFYAGSGLGLGLYRLGSGALRRRRRETPVAWPAAPWLAAAILAGGVVAPVLMLFGLAEGSATQTTLLLNLEGVFTALLAWFVFKEAFAARIAAGMASISLGAVILAWDASGGTIFDWSAVLVIAACLAWGVDNNLTRRVSSGDPVQIAALKGAAAGVLNLAIALSRGAEIPPPALLVGAGMIGLLGYGASLVLFVLALRHLGTARTAAYFSTAPFIGSIAAVAVLGEALTMEVMIAGLLMAVGVWLHLSERHDHEHLHAPLEHNHLHSHDTHHQHHHPAGVPAGEPHAHLHAHQRIQHSHPHYPDLHHRHRH